MTQREAILRHLQSHGSITPLQALREYGIFRLAARVWELRAEGFPIETDEEVTPNSKRIARYRLLQEPVQQEMFR